VSAGIWFWIFMLMIVMVMFNVLLAIVLDTYITVKKKAMSAETLVRTVSEMRRRRNQYKAGKRVRLNDIFDGIKKKDEEAGINEDEMMKSEEMLTPQLLLDMVPDLKLEQAERTMNNAAKEHKKKTEEPLKMEDAHQRLQKMNSVTEKVRDDLLQIAATLHHYDTTNQYNEADQPESSKGMAELATSTTQETPVNQNLLDSISAEVGRLTGEVASTLAQTMKSVDKRQSHLEVRQQEMLGSVRELQTRLQVLQSESLGLTTRLNRYVHRKNAKQPRKGIAGSLVPACMSCSEPDLRPPEKT
jgi:hypothetical protein